MMTCTITSRVATQNIDEVESVTLQTQTGQIELLPGHTEAFIQLEQGSIVCRKNSGEAITIVCASGVCHVRDDTILIIHHEQ